MGRRKLVLGGCLILTSSQSRYRHITLSLNSIPRVLRPTQTLPPGQNQHHLNFTDTLWVPLCPPSGDFGHPVLESGRRLVLHV